MITCNFKWKQIFWVLFVKYRGNFVWTQGCFGYTLLISSGWFVYQTWHTIICVCFNVESSWLLQFCGSPKITPCVCHLGIMYLAGKGEQSSKATIRELFSPAREQETRGGHCFHLVRFAWPRCNNQLADGLTVKSKLGRELKAGHAFSLHFSLFIPCWEM